MPNFEEIKELIKKCNTPYIQVKDAAGNKIISVETASVALTLRDFDAWENMLRSYGKLEVIGSETPNYKGAYKWILIFDKPANNQMSGMPQNFSGMNWGAPAGFVSIEVMNEKIATLVKENEWNKKFAELEAKINNKKDPDQIEKMIGYVPMIGSALGWGDEKIEKMVKYYAMSQGASKGMAFVPPKNTLTFKDVEQMTPEEKNAKIQSLLDSLGTKVSAEHMILLLEALDKKPELAEKAVSMLSMI